MLSDVQRTFRFDVLEVAIALRKRSGSRFQQRSGWNGRRGVVVAVLLDTAVVRGYTTTAASG